MAELTRAVTMSDRERAMVVSILLKAGHTTADVTNAVDCGRWDLLPFTEDERRLLTCPHCGVMPRRQEGSGRLVDGCIGQCLMRAAINEKEGAKYDRADRVATAAKRGIEEDSAFLQMVQGPQRGTQESWLSLD